MIECRQLGFVWPSRTAPVTALLDFSLEIKEGEVMAILGPSGCGKSTLLPTLAGIKRPTSGEVVIDGRPLQFPDPLTTIVFQERTLFPWLRTWENVAFSLKMRRVKKQERHTQAERVLEEIGLHDFTNSFPKELSGGMYQRATVARALVADRDILLLDEPLGSLDALTRRKMWAWLEKVQGMFKRTVVLVTHDVEEAVALADRIAITTPRPARVKTIVDVTLPRPRTIMNGDFISIKREVLNFLT